MKRDLTALAVLGTLLLAAVGAEGTQYPAFEAQNAGGSVWTYSGTWTDGDGTDHDLAAQVSFSRVRRGKMKVRLSNTFAGDVMFQVELLSAVFFDVAGSVPMTPYSAIVPDGSEVLFPEAANPSQPHAPLAPNVVGGEFAFKSGLEGAPGDAAYGISGVGIDLFGPHDLFPPQIDLDKPASPDGSNYGITSAGDDPNTGNNPDVTGQEPIIKHEVVFTFCGLPCNFKPCRDITNVWFLYGTSWEQQPGEIPPPIPEPISAVCVAAGLAGLGGYLRKRLARK